MIAYLTSLLTLSCIFGLLAAGLNVLVGYAGIFSVAHAVFFGVGAYAGAQFAMLVSPDLVLCAAAGGVAGGVASLGLAIPALRVRGEYLVAASLGLQMLAVTVFTSGGDVTGGVGGLVGIPGATLAGFDISAPTPFLLASAAVLAGALLAIRVLMRGSFGRALTCIRDSESAAEAFGKDVRRLKALAIGLGCALAGVAGVLFAFSQQFVNVETFTMDQSILILAMVIIGGAGTLAGPVAGAVLLLLLPAALSFLPFLPPTEIGAVQQMIYGLAMVLLMLFRPAGIAGAAVGRRVT